MPLNCVKARRITRACDFCHRRGLKCKEAEQDLAPPGLSASSCLTCLDYGETCTRNRQPKKRGTKRQRVPSQTVEHDRLAQINPFRILGELELSSGTSKSQALGSRKIITVLLDVYLDTVHPMFPFFCEREIWVGWRDGSFPGGALDYTNLMCMCALSALHVDNRALFSNDDPALVTETFAQDYLQEAERLVADSCNATDAVKVIRSYGFLALLGAQSGNSIMVHKYLGLFHGVCSQSNIHDESRWPSEMGDCEKEIRRRLWWAMYRLEVHTACVLGSLIRCSETQCDVGYPFGPHHPAFIPGRDGQFEDWFSGWNLTTDLYRLLEHAVLNLRSKHRKYRSVLDGCHSPAANLVNEKLSKLQDQLLPQFGSVSSRSSDSGRNRCGFQACNILCTIHLARMVSSLAGEDSTGAACHTARDLMNNMNSVPHEYIRATGSPLLQQLAGVGHMLLGVARKDIAIQAHYPMFKDVMSSIISFLTRFSEYNKLAAVAKDKLSAELMDYEHGNQNLMLCGPTDDESSQDDTVQPWSYFDMFTYDGEGGLDFFNANLLRAFAWPSNHES